MDNLHVNEQRLWNSLMEMAAIGALPNGGCRRLALSSEDGKCRDLFVKWCSEAGCQVRCDQVGNIYARRAGRNNKLPAVATGSHLDTQPHGGKFDGAYGVLAGLEAIRTLNDHKITTERPIDVIVWTNEEGARIVPPLFGSAAFAEKLAVEYIHSLSTVDNTKVVDDLKRIGYLGDEVPGSRKLNCFFEVHIEQGPMLESESLDIGVVTQIQGMIELNVTLEGLDGHGGTVPMKQRRDAMIGAAKMITNMADLASNGDEAIRLTVGYLKVTPNAGATIPGKVEFTVDLRHPDNQALVEYDRRIRIDLQRIAEQSGLSIQIVCDFIEAPVFFDNHAVDIVEKSVQRLGYSYKKMISGAGHDAMNLASVVPTAMIFVPCKNGISHNEAEYANPESLAAGTNVLLQSILQVAAFCE